MLKTDLEACSSKATHSDGSGSCGVWSAWPREVIPGLRPRREHLSAGDYNQSIKSHQY